MKRLAAMLLAVALLMAALPTALADTVFDLSVFDDEDVFHRDISASDGTGTITTTHLIHAQLDEEEGVLIGEFDVSITDFSAPIITLYLFSLGAEPIGPEKFSMELEGKRYTFSAFRAQGGEGLSELIAVIISGTAVEALKAIVDHGESDIPFVLEGERTATGKLTVDGLDGVEALYDAFVASGALENSFVLVDILFPFEIEELQ